MKKSSFRALTALLVGLPVLAFAAGVAHPRGRAFLVALASPLPTTTPRAALDAGVAALPPLTKAVGAESVALRTLREDTPANGGFDTTRMAAARALFPDEASPPASSYIRPTALRPQELASRGDPSIDPVLARIQNDERVRARFVSALRASGRPSLAMQRILQAWKLPDSVLAVAFVESAFVADAAPSLGTDAGESDGGAGLWGLTRDMAHVYGLSMLADYDERRSISSGTEAAARYLADLHERFGSWELAFVAFGFGYRATLEELAKHAGSDFWDLAPELPPAVYRYVTHIMATALVLGNLDRFGFDAVARDPAIATSELEVTAGTPLDVVARAAGISPSLLRELNPEYLSGIVPTTSFAMGVQVPSESFVRAREMLPRLLTGAMPESDASAPDDLQHAPPEPSPVLSRGADSRMFYRVREGDTVAALAQRYEVSVAILASDNALDPTGELKPGMILSIRLPAPAAPASSPQKQKTKQHGRRTGR